MPRARADRYAATLAPIGAVALGVAMLFGPTFASGFSLYPSDPADPRYSEYLFEHTWQWLVHGIHARYFDVPMGYPVRNMVAHSEPLLTFAPFYWLFRALGLPSSISHPCWLALVSALNFAAFFAWMRMRLRVDALAASAAAFLFAFGLARAATMGHSQLWPQFYLVLVLFGLHGLVGETASDRARAWGAPLVVIGLALQAWGCLYNGIFFAYVCAVTALFAVCHPAWRARALRALVRTTPWGAACAGLALLSLWPLAAAYLPVAAASDAWNPAELRALQPRPGSLVYVWPQSWYYGWMSATALGRLPAAHEQALGFGLLTTAVVLFTALRRRREPVVRLLAVLVATLLLPLIVWPGDVTLWPRIQSHLPGLGSLRATCRIGLLLSIPISAALGLFLAERSRARRPELWLAIAALCVIEQGTRPRVFDNRGYERLVEQIAARIDPHAEAFFFVGAGLVPSWFSQIDGLLASQRTGVPTVNMYAARTPLGFGPLMHHSVARDPTSLRGVGRELDRWLTEHGIDPKHVQRIAEYEILSDRQP